MTIGYSRSNMKKPQPLPTKPGIFCSFRTHASLNDELHSETKRGPVRAPQWLEHVGLQEHHTNWQYPLEFASQQFWWYFHCNSIFFVPCHAWPPLFHYHAAAG